MDPLETLMVPGQIIISSNLLQGDDSRDGSFKVNETLVYGVLRMKDDTTRSHPSSRDSQIPARYALAVVIVRFIADSRREAESSWINMESLK